VDLFYWGKGAHTKDPKEVGLLGVDYAAVEHPGKINVVLRGLSVTAVLRASPSSRYEGGTLSKWSKVP
jgi:hypothetical protein